MIRTLPLAVCLLAALAWGQAMKMTVGQLKSFVRSSIQMKHDDAKVAAYLKKVTLSQRLTTEDVDELLSLGAGAKTADALSALVGASVKLEPPPADRVVAKTPPPPMPPPDAETQRRVIEEAREVALNYTKNLPNFICLQYTRRYYDPSGLEQFILSDKVAERLSYFEQKEDYKVISVNGSLVTKGHDDLGGATSSGEFGSMLKEIFEPGTHATFQWERWAKLRGRLAHVYSYQVEKAYSRWSISWQKQMTVTPAYRGLIYVEKDAPAVVRVTLETVDVPATFPIQEARTMLDYDVSEIAGQPFLLPLRAEMRMREGKLLVKNEVEFRSYRKYGAETSITFDTSAEPIPDDKLKEEPVPNKPKKP